MKGVGSSPAAPRATRGAEREGPPREGWLRATYLVAGAMLLALIVVALRPGFPVGPAVYGAGLPLLGTLALLLILVGLVVSVRRPPILRPERLRAFLVLAATAFVAVLPIPYPSSHAEHPGALTFELPVRGTWEVVLGGDDAFANTLVLSPQLRFALGLSRPPGEASGPGGAVVGAPVHAPCDGLVVEVEGGLPDLPPDAAPPRGTHRAGNRIVLEVAPDRFLFLVGLQQGSLEVGVGERVARGQRLARVGRSSPRLPGAADHFLFHLQDRPEWGRGEGVPWRFGGYFVLEDGAGAGAGSAGATRGPVERERPEPGQRLRFR